MASNNTHLLSPSSVDQKHERLAGFSTLSVTKLKSVCALGWVPYLWLCGTNRLPGTSGLLAEFSFLWLRRAFPWRLLAEGLSQFLEDLTISYILDPFLFLRSHNGGVEWFESLWRTFCLFCPCPSSLASLWRMVLPLSPAFKSHVIALDPLRYARVVCLSTA